MKLHLVPRFRTRGALYSQLFPHDLLSGCLLPSNRSSAPSLAVRLHARKLQWRASHVGHRCYQDLLYFNNAALFRGAWLRVTSLTPLAKCLPPPDSIMSNGIHIGEETRRHEHKIVYILKYNIVADTDGQTEVVVSMYRPSSTKSAHLSVTFWQ